MSAWIEIERALDAGKLAILPTETVYGLSARADNTVAVDAVYAVKGRDFNKPLALCVRDLKQAESFGEFDEKARELAKNHWPGPVTLVVRSKADTGLDPRVGTGATIALRCPDVFWRTELDKPLALTSANLSGEPDAVTLDLARGTLGPDIIALTAQAPLSGSASTILSILDGEVKVLRQGDTQVAA